MDASIGLPDPGAELRAIYDESLPQVYGYLARRCGSPLVAEDLTAETYLAAVSSIGRGAVDQVTVAWLVGIARHKLVDHWRADARRTRHLELAWERSPDGEDPWAAVLDEHLAHEVLTDLGPHHRSVLSLRYLDGLPVAEVAGILDRTVGATEALLTRAKAAFRHSYESITEGGEDQ